MGVQILFNLQNVFRLLPKSEALRKNGVEAIRKEPVIFTFNRHNEVILRYVAKRRQKVEPAILSFFLENMALDENLDIMKVIGYSAHFNKPFFRNKFLDLGIHVKQLGFNCLIKVPVRFHVDNPRRINSLAENLECGFKIFRIKNPLICALVQKAISHCPQAGYCISITLRRSHQSTSTL